MSFSYLTIQNSFIFIFHVCNNVVSILIKMLHFSLHRATLVNPLSRQYYTGFTANFIKLHEFEKMLNLVSFILFFATAWHIFDCEISIASILNNTIFN